MDSQTHHPIDAPSARRRILVADDDPAILRLIVATLARSFEVLGAADGGEALALFEKNGCDLLVTDLNMPRLNGIALAHHVRQRQPYLPIVLLTGSMWETEGTELLVTQILKKPFRMHELEAAVQRIFHGNSKLAA